MKYLLIGSVALAVWLLEIGAEPPKLRVGSDAEAVIGRPVTPVSYAGVARRSTVGLGAPGVGVAPRNKGGPVNRVGRW
jgi:hypothetical protein